MATTCLNCKNPITENYCAKCGQKASVHRYSFHHFIEHDLIHGVWHVDNGIFFTLKELFTRPGHSIREFINGKRAGYFSFFTLLVLILGITHFLGEYAQVKLSDLMPEDSKATMNKVQELTSKYPKLYLLLTMPIYSISSFLWFKKAKLNLTEHFVLNAYKTAGEALIGLLPVALTVFYTNVKVLPIIFSLIGLFSLIYAFWYYKQFFSAYGYSKKSLVIRSLCVILSYFSFSVLVGIIMGIIQEAK